MVRDPPKNTGKGVLALMASSWVCVCETSAGQCKQPLALPAPAWSLVYGAGEGGKARRRRPEPIPIWHRVHVVCTWLRVPPIACYSQPPQAWGRAA